MAACVFCQIVAGEVPAERIAEDDRTLAFMDIAPGNRGHALVIPKRHADDLLAIEPDELAAVTRMAQHVARRQKDVLDADGVNLVNSCGAAAWQTVFHLHVHVIPRYTDDPLRLPWTPTEGDPADIASVAKELRT